MKKDEETARESQRGVHRRIELTGSDLEGAALGVHGEVVEVHGTVGVDGHPGGGGREALVFVE